MNLFDKLAVSLLVVCGMLVGQIEAAMPGAFSRLAETDRERVWTDESGSPPIQMVPEFFLMVKIFSYNQDNQDRLGNLTSRTDNIAKRAESFGYDSLNRLESSSVSSLAGAPTSTVPPPQSYSYATNGNLLTKGSSATLTYANPTKPHAVSSAIVKGSSRTYLYDSAGYVHDDGKRQFEWTSFGQLERLEYAAAPELKDFSGNLVHPAGRVVSVFDFDSGGNRARQTKERTAANDSREIESTLYLGSYEREIHQTKADGAAPAVLVKTVHRHTLGGGIIYTRTMGGSAPGVKLMNVLADHLGSTDVILTGIWNGSSFASHTTEFQSFDAWGERRDATTQVNHRSSDSDPFRTSANDHDRGYTGHEQLDDSGLIHMNGRIYDPELGRFLSPDPVVQIPEYSQNFNRYSYVLNNPLNATDPSGFSFLSKVFHKIGSFIKENWRTIVMIVVTVVLTVITAGVATATAAAVYGATSSIALASAAAYAAWGATVGFLSGGLSAALNGGDLGDVLRGAFVQGISGALTGPLHMVGGLANIVGHGIVGGATNVAMGGKFSDGFLSAAAGAATAVAGLTSPDTKIGQSLGLGGRTAIASAVGGTASVLGGGKFANGAFTAAFQHLVNAEFIPEMWAQKQEYMWTTEHRNEIIESYKSQGLEFTNRSIDSMKRQLLIDIQHMRLTIFKDLSQVEFERMSANIYQSLNAAIMASASLDPNFKFGPSVNITATLGGGYIIGGNAGVVVDDNSLKAFYGYGFATKGIIASFAIGKGNSPSLGSKTTSYSLGSPWGIGVGHENGGFSGQFSTTGFYRMKNTYFYEKK